MEQPWHDRFIIVGDLGEFAEEAEEYRLAPTPPAQYCGRELTLTDYDMAVRDLSWEALDLTYRDLGVRLEDELGMRYCLLDDETYTQEHGASGGCSMYRDIFVKKNRSAMKRLHDALHESAHATSHIAVTARRLLVDGAWDLCIAPHRSGLQFLPFGRKALRHRFLNEAATDIVARRAAAEMQNKLSSPLVRAEDVEAAANYWSYGYPVQLVIALAERLAPDFDGAGNAVRQLLIDYVNGTNRFLTALRRREPRAVKLLATAEPDKAGTVALAEQLGYDDVTADIRA